MKGMVRLGGSWRSTNVGSLIALQVTDVFKLEDYQAALDKMNSRGALKIAIRP